MTCHSCCYGCHKTFDFDEIENHRGDMPSPETIVAWTIREALAREGFTKKYRESYPDMPWEKRPVRGSENYYGVTQESFHDEAAQAAVGLMEAMKGLDLTLPEIIRALEKAHEALKENKRDRL